MLQVLRTGAGAMLVILIMFLGSLVLWVGTPLVTCRGNSFAGRVAASLLTAMGLPELVTDNLEAYEALIVKLASDTVLLGAIRSKLRDQRRSAPLFDTSRFTRHIEAAYTVMVERLMRGEAPQGFAVTPEDA